MTNAENYSSTSGSSAPRLSCIYETKFLVIHQQTVKKQNPLRHLNVTLLLVAHYLFPVSVH